ncbi:MAG: adenylate/guanylate cyclase domain-containing protein [Flavobacteriales bacterium]
MDSTYTSFVDQEVNFQGGTLPLLDSMLNVYRSERDTCHMAHVGLWRSTCFDAIGQLDSAVAVAQRAQSWFRPGCDSLTLMAIAVNLGNVHQSLGEFDRVLEISNRALALWNGSWPYSKARNSLYTNRAIAMANLGDLPAALEAFRDVLRNAHAERIVQVEVDALGNLGALFGMMSEGGKVPAFMDSSTAYTQRALVLCKAMKDSDCALRKYFNLAHIAKDRAKPRVALTYLDSAHVLAEELGDLTASSSIAEARSRNFFALGELDSAYSYLDLHLVLRDSLLNTEKVKAIADVQEKYESEKKARTIKELEVEQLGSKLKQAQLTRTRNIFLFSGIGVLLVAGGLWSRLRFTNRARAAIQKEKDVSEGLLLNILPEEVAAELKAKGYADAREFDQATILFTDFKGFTALSQLLTAAQLVAEIDHCFKAFDDVMEKYHIEKIKTIGDAYMAAGGLPDPVHGKPEDVVRAALEMQGFMAAYAKERKAQGRPYFEMRVGVHTGPVIAGIVGVKKFAYDIWGDTVNTASRMESSGEVGRVNLSNATYELVRGATDLTFTPRGLVQAKGKGDMEMWFVDHRVA